MKRLISMLLVLCLTLSLLPATAWAATEIASGTCGENLTWVLDDGGTLTISGTGPMTDYGLREAPWYGYNKDIQNIVIEKGAETIGAAAFYHCFNVTEVVLPSGVTSVGESAFTSCGGLVSITIPDGVRSIGNDAFEYCSSLTEITIPDSVISLGDQAFRECESLTKATLSDSMTSIGEETFADCWNLSAVEIPDSIVTIGQWAFICCYGLTGITIPDGVTTIGFGAFDSCAGLTDITIPASVTSIAHYAFSHCAGLKGIWVDENNVNYSNDTQGVVFNKDQTVLIAVPGGMEGTYEIPDCVHMIEEGAFTGCAGLTGIVIPSSVTTIDNEVFGECTGLRSVQIPDSITEINRFVFYGCTSLTNVSIPDSVASIGEYAFCCCSSLSSVVIPDSVTAISNMAFAVCESLSEVRFAGNVPAISHNAFDNSVLTAYYPENNTTWTSDVMQNYGGTITWTSYIPGAESDFTDVISGEYYYAPVLWAVDNGITNGLSPTTFGVDENCTRAQFVTFLWRAAGCPEPAATVNPFADVEDNQFYSKAVLWAVEKGITTGLAADRFGVNDPCTRAQVVTFLHRYAGNPAPGITDNPFDDAAPGQFYSTAILWAVENGITTGLDAATFGVNNPCSRAQVVTFLYRALNG